MTDDEHEALANATIFLTESVDQATHVLRRANDLLRELRSLDPDRETSEHQPACASADDDDVLDQAREARAHEARWRERERCRDNTTNS